MIPFASALLGRGRGVTWNPQDKAASIILSQADRIAATTGANGAVRATSGKSSGKHYFEVVYTGNSNGYVGVMRGSSSLSSGPGSSAGTGLNLSGGVIYSDGIDTGESISFALGNRIGVAVDMSGLVSIYNRSNGQSGAVGLPAGTGPLFPAASFGTAGSQGLLLTGTSIIGPIPSGYEAWRA